MYRAVQWAWYSTHHDLVTSMHTLPHRLCNPVCQNCWLEPSCTPSTSLAAGGHHQPTKLQAVCLNHTHRPAMVNGEGDKVQQNSNQAAEGMHNRSVPTC
jgi:hypothetical protein